MSESVPRIVQRPALRPRVAVIAPEDDTSTQHAHEVVTKLTEPPWPDVARCALNAAEAPGVVQPVIGAPWVMVVVLGGGVTVTGTELMVRV